MPPISGQDLGQDLTQDMARSQPPGKILASCQDLALLGKNLAQELFAGMVPSSDPPPQSERSGNCAGGRYFGVLLPFWRPLLGVRCGGAGEICPPPPPPPPRTLVRPPLLSGAIFASAIISTVGVAITSNPGRGGGGGGGGGVPDVIDKCT